MSTIDDFQKQHEARLTDFIAGLSGRSAESDWALTRALVHKAVHLVAERGAGEFCAVATFLAEMIGHAHQIMHTTEKSESPHRDVVH